MFKFCKIACKTFTNYRFYRSRPRCSQILFASVTPVKHNVRLTAHIFIHNKNPRRFASDIAIALSILTWLGFTEEDENKESELIMTLKRAVLCTQREEYNKAEQMLHLALRIAQQQQNEQGILYCYDLMANLAFEQLQLDKAEKLFVSVMQMLLGNGMEHDDIKVIHISLKMSRIYQLKADMERAEIGYKWCLEKIAKQKNRNIDAKLLYGLINDWYAQFLLDKGEVTKSLHYLEEAYKICKQTEKEDKSTSVLLLNDLGTTSFRAEDDTAAELYLKEAIRIGNDLEDKSHLGVVHANLGLILLYKGIIAGAEQFCKEAWHLGISHENVETVEQANYCFDQIKLSMGNQSKSV